MEIKKLTVKIVNVEDEIVPCDPQPSTSAVEAKCNGDARTEIDPREPRQPSLVRRLVFAVRKRFLRTGFAIRKTFRVNRNQPKRG